MPRRWAGAAASEDKTQDEEHGVYDAIAARRQAPCIEIAAAAPAEASDEPLLIDPQLLYGQPLYRKRDGELEWRIRGGLIPGPVCPPRI